jgi:rhodanese-related sulfurtransferase
MTLFKTLFQALLILAISAILGFANNYINPNRVELSHERPTADIAADSTFERENAPATGPVVVGKKQLKTLVQEENAIIVDARSPEEFLTGHIQDAINIPFDRLGEFIEQVDALPKDKWIVTYCDGPPCDKSEMLAFELFQMGFERVAYYDAGLEDWKTTEDIDQ